MEALLPCKGMLPNLAPLCVSCLVYNMMSLSLALLMLPLGLEMLELLEIFRSVHKDVPEENKEDTLQKVSH